MDIKNKNVNENECTLPRTLCVFLLDRSASMLGDPIDKLNIALKEMISEIANNEELYNRLELSIVQFNEKADCLVQPSFAKDINPVPVLTAKGQANIIDTVMEGLIIAKERKEYYISIGLHHYRPWIVLITNGGDNSGKNPDDLANILKKLDNGKNIAFLPIGLPTADFIFLNKIATDRFKPVTFTEFFKWLSASLSSFVSDSDKGNDPELGWGMVKN